MADTLNDLGSKLGAGNGKDPIVEKLDLLLEAVEEIQEALEEITEKLADLELPYNAGFRYD